MKIKEVNGWEIMYNKNSIAPYQVKTGNREDQRICFKTLKGAAKWAEKH